MTTHRDHVDERLGRKMTAAEFRWLAEQDEWADLVGGIHDPDTAAQDCADLVRAREVLESVAQQVPDTGAMPAGERERMRAKALVLHRLANARADVVEWRTDHDLVPVEEVGEWVRSHQGSGKKSPGHQLAFPDGGHLGRVATSEGSVLRALLTLSSRLVLEYAWTEDTATAFVLSDAVPIPKWVRVTTHQTGDVYGARIILDVDPDTPAEVVARIYSEARADFRSELGRGGRPPEASTFAMFAGWVARGCGELTKPELRRLHDGQGMNGDRRSARRKLVRCWEYLTGEPFSRN